MGRPIVAVTGIGVVTSLGVGKTDNWAALTSGKSGIHPITRFPSTISTPASPARSISCRRARRAPAPSPTNWPKRRRSKRLPKPASNAAISAARCSSPRRRWNSTGRPLLALRSPARTAVRRRCCGSRAGRIRSTFRDHPVRLDRRPARRPFRHAGPADHAVHRLRLGRHRHPARRRGDPARRSDAALSIGADGSATAEALIRFSLLSALSTSNDDPGKSLKTVLEGSRRLRARRRLGGAGAGIAGERAGARGANDARHRARLRRKGRRFPPHPFQARRLAGDRGRARGACRCRA